MERIAKALIEAATLRENSFDQVEAVKIFEKEMKERNLIMDFNQLYRVSLREACDKAAESAGFDLRGTDIIYMLLNSNWNESLDWANQYEEE